MYISINNKTNSSITCEDSYENTPDTKEHIANDTPRQDKGSITRMLGDTMRIEPTLQSAELGSSDEERRRDKILQNTENELRASLLGMQGYHK
jgi:hypothetical protein